MAVQTYINALQPVNVGGALAAGQEQGRKDAQQLAVRNALSSYATDPQGAQSALVAAGAIPEANQLSQYGQRQRAQGVQDRVAPLIGQGDYAGAIKAAGEGGDVDMVSQLTDAQAKRAHSLAQTKADISDQLLQVPAPNGDLTARTAAMQRFVPQLTALGVPADSIGKEPLTDEYLTQSVQDGLSLAERIAARKPVSVAAGSSLVNPQTGKAVYTGAPKAASGYEVGEDGTTHFIPNGPADPAVIARNAGVRRSVVVNNPIPKRATVVDGVPVGGVSKAAAQAGLTDDAIQQAAEAMVGGGSIPALGVGKAAVAAKEAIINRVAAIRKAGGIDGYKGLQAQADYKANTQSLNQNTKLKTAVDSFEATAVKNGDLALSLAGKGGGPTGSPVLNRWIQHGRKSIAGDPDVAAFDAALGTFADEYAKIVSGNTGSAGATEGVRAEVQRRINGAMSPAQLQAVIAVMKKEMRNRSVSLEEKGAELRAKITANPAAPKPPANRPPLSAIFK